MSDHAHNHSPAQIHAEDLARRLDRAEELTESLFATVDELLHRQQP